MYTCNNQQCVHVTCMYTCNNQQCVHVTCMYTCNNQQCVHAGNLIKPMYHNDHITAHTQFNNKIHINLQVTYGIIILCQL